MNVVHAVVLAIVQGLTEFLPVSSSGHLILVPRLLGWDEHPLSFDVTLHLGTTLAVLLYFRRDFLRLTRAALHDLATQRQAVRRWSAEGRLALLIALGSVPAVIVGGLFNSAIEQHARAVWLIAALLIVVGLVMLAAERRGQRTDGMERLDARRAILVGVAQALALLPGVSRSGATIAAGMFVGLSRESATRFSFLLAAPVVVAAAVKQLPDIRHASADGVSAGALAVGVIVSFAVGLATVHLLLGWVAARRLDLFVWYRIAFAVFAVIALGLR